MLNLGDKICTFNFSTVLFRKLVPKYYFLNLNY